METGQAEASKWPQLERGSLESLLKSLEYSPVKKKQAKAYEAVRQDLGLGAGAFDYFFFNKKEAEVI